MATPRIRKTRLFTLSDEAIRLLERAENRSQYVDYLIRTYPPPRSDVTMGKPRSETRQE